MDFHFDYLTRRTTVLGLQLWVLFCIGLGACIVLVIIIGYLWRSFRRKAAQRNIVFLHKDSLEVRIHRSRKQPIQPVSDGSSSSPMTEDKKIMEEEIYAMQNLVGNKLDDELLHVVDGAPIRAFNLDKADREYKGKYLGKAKLAARGEEVRREIFIKKRMEKGEPVSECLRALSPEDSACSPPVYTTSMQGSSLGWGHSYSRNELDVATNYFSEANILGKGSHGIVYYGQFQNGTRIALKKLLNNREQAEKEFRVEVEAIGRVRHKNLVRLVGCCMEGSERMLVYEFVDNGNVEQWLHGPLGDLPPLSWEIRMKIILGTARGLAYLHEGLEPKVVHRDVKSRNILLDSHWNPKVSDFGFAKLLENGNAHVTTMVIGTYGYVAPEYASTGMLTEKSDVFSYGVLIMELVTGRLPVDVNRRHAEVNLVDWLKKMVASRRADEVIDAKIKVKPSSRSLKRVLLVALRCVDPDAQRRPKMSHVVHMLEAADENQIPREV